MGLLSDAMESLVNLASAIFGLLMVTVAAQPADEEHPYGHHKAEYFSSGFEGILIKMAGLAPSGSEANRLIDGGGVRVDSSVVSDKGLKLEAGTYVVQVGKRKFARVHLSA